MNQIISNYFEENDLLKNISIEGEIGNLSRSKSGHIYFNLKDKTSIISVNVWKSVVERSLTSEDLINLKDGSKVIIKGEIKVYVDGGKYNLIANKITFVGGGDLYKEFLILKEQLKAIGLFDEARKKKIKRFNYRIGVITSKEGAVIRDIQTTIKRRFPNVLLTLYDTIVQGSKSKDDLINSLKKAESNHHDVIIIARGGGSMEDLWSFNDRDFALEISNCKTPIISAVGHETDFTICDFVADLRAPTPTAAAELVNPNVIDVIQELKQMEQIFFHKVNSIIQDIKLQLSNSNHQLDQVRNYLKKLHNDFLIMERKFIQISRSFVSKQKNDLINNERRFDSNIRIMISNSKSLLYSLQNQFAIQRIKSSLSTLKEQTLIADSKLNRTIINHKFVYQKYLNDFSIRINNSMENYLIEKGNLLKMLEQKMDSVNPQNILKRGYLYATKNNSLIKELNTLAIGDEILIHLVDGEASTIIKEIRGNKNDKK